MKGEKVYAKDWTIWKLLQYVKRQDGRSTDDIKFKLHNM